MADLRGFNAHEVEPTTEFDPIPAGMYRTFLADAKVINPQVRVIGLTATPYRMASGMMDRDRLVDSACREIVELSQDRKSVLIFAAGIKHGWHICDVLLRPTMSPGLYYQMVGRGFRLHPGKNDCLVLDFGGNILRHGPVDQIRIEDKANNGNGPAPAKECPECHSVIAAGYATCPDCGHEFPPPERAKHDSQASNAGILSGEVIDTEYDVQDVLYYVHIKRDAPDDAPRTMRVEYRLGLDYWVSEWICFEHTGYPRRKAEAWWKQRSPDPVPDTADEAVALAEAGALAHTESITVRSVTGENFDRIIACKLGPMPEACPAGPMIDFDDVPF